MSVAAAGGHNSLMMGVETQQLHVGNSRPRGSFPVCSYLMC